MRISNPQSLKGIKRKLATMIELTIHSPAWFLGVDASLEAFAALIAFFVTFASYKVYRVSKENRYRSFMTAFILLTLSFLVRAGADSILEKIFLHLSQGLYAKVFFIGYVLHIFLALSAYLLLIAITHKIAQRRIIGLISILLFVAMILSGSYFLSFYIISTVLLAFVCVAYFQNFRKVHSQTSCLVFIAFLLLTLAQPQFLLEAVNDVWYATAHITQALGYLTLLITLLRLK